ISHQYIGVSRQGVDQAPVDTRWQRQLEGLTGYRWFPTLAGRRRSGKRFQGVIRRSGRKDGDRNPNFSERGKMHYAKGIFFSPAKNDWKMKCIRLGTFCGSAGWSIPSSFGTLK